MKKLNKKGFTIVELVIVIAVIAILAAVLIPTFATVINKANESAALQNARNTFTEYIASLGEEIPAEINLIVKGADKMYFAVVDGQMSKTVYETTTAAEDVFPNAPTGFTKTPKDVGGDFAEKVFEPYTANS